MKLTVLFKTVRVHKFTEEKTSMFPNWPRDELCLEEWNWWLTKPLHVLALSAGDARSHKPRIINTYIRSIRTWFSSGSLTCGIGRETSYVSYHFISTPLLPIDSSNKATEIGWVGGRHNCVMGIIVMSLMVYIVWYNQVAFSIIITWKLRFFPKVPSVLRIHRCGSGLNKRAHAHCHPQAHAHTQKTGRVR